MKNKRVIKIAFTMVEAEELGLLGCSTCAKLCGYMHPLTNHFDDDMGCAHCKCAKYKMAVRRGKLIK